jgi:hypothetical protein
VPWRPKNSLKHCCPAPCQAWHSGVAPCSYQLGEQLVDVDQGVVRAAVELVVGPVQIRRQPFPVEQLGELPEIGLVGGLQRRQNAARPIAARPPIRSGRTASRRI